jgi:chemotaxis protein histidine kinase CheA
MTDAQTDFLELFREEGNERLDNMIGCLLSLERGEAPEETIKSLFREAHTIKGAAGMLGSTAYTISLTPWKTCSPTCATRARSLRRWLIPYSEASTCCGGRSPARANLRLS